MRNETTGETAASIAGYIMANDPLDNDRMEYWVGGSGKSDVFWVTGKQLKTMAGSLLTQAADKPLRVAAKPRRSVKRAK